MVEHFDKINMGPQNGHEQQAQASNNMLDFVHAQQQRELTKKDATVVQSSKDASKDDSKDAPKDIKDARDARDAHAAVSDAAHEAGDKICHHVSNAQNLFNRLPEDHKNEFISNQIAYIKQIQDPHLKIAAQMTLGQLAPGAEFEDFVKTVRAAGIA